jgi:hypothetical protein
MDDTEDKATLINDFELERIDDFELDKKIDSNWQVVLIYMFKNTAIVSIPYEGFYGSKETEYVKMFSHLFFIMSDIGLSNEFDKDVDRKMLNSQYPVNENIESIALKSVENISRQIFAKLDLFGYVTSVDKTIFGTTVGYTEYKITEKGIDIALRLQEHNDSEKRHITITKISRFSLVFSLVAVILAGVSAYLSYERLENYKVANPPKVKVAITKVTEPTKT